MDNVFQYLPRDHSYIESLDIQEQVIPTPNPNPPNDNPNYPTRHSSSSSSSSQPLPLEFLVDFTIHDSAPPSFPYINPLHLLSQRLTTSNTLSIDPNLHSTWSSAHLELNRIGLESRFIEPVINVLQAKVYSIVSYFPTHPYGCGQASVKLQVNIKRITVVPIHPAPWLPMVPIHHVQWVTAPPPLAPLDYDHHHHQHEDDDEEEEEDEDEDDDHDDHDHEDDDDDDRFHPDHDEYDEMLAIETLEIVKAEDEEAFIKVASCAICLEDFQVVMEEKKVKEVPMKLPCKHVFHEGCIRGWFKKSHFCPLCRSNVLAS